MTNDYSHMVWVEGLLIDLNAQKDDDEAKSITLADAHDHFKTLTPDQKSDVMLYLLGRLAT